MIYTIKENNKQPGSFLSIVLGPALSINSQHGYGYDMDKVLSRIKFITATPHHKWSIIEFEGLDPSWTCRLFVVIDAIAVLFKDVAATMRVETVPVQKLSVPGEQRKYKVATTAEFTEKQLHEIREFAVASKGIEMSIPQDEARYFDSPLSYVFDNPKQSEQFMKDLESLGLSAGVDAERIIRQAGDRALNQIDTL